MARILIVYASSEGQTAKIAEHIARRLREKNHRAEIVDGARLPGTFSVDGYDAAIVGAPVRMARHPAPIIEFVKTNRAFLERVPSAFFSVCMAAASPRPEKQREALARSENFFGITGWQLRHSAIFSGALRYRAYNFLLRFMMRRIARSEGVNTDTSRDHEYTDWEVVTRFADEFAGLM
jgi:menaquinone-dependent protoporphyrinogen oxidase